MFQLNFAFFQHLFDKSIDGVRPFDRRSGLEIVEKTGQEEIGPGDLLDRHPVEKLTDFLVTESIPGKLREAFNRVQHALEVTNRPGP